MSSGDDKSPLKRLVSEPKLELAQVANIVEETPQSAPKTQTAPITGNKQDWMRAAGIPQSDWRYVDYIISSESGWCPTIWNGGTCGGGMPAGSSGAYGLCQSLPASKMATAGADYMTNPVTQLRWCNSYAKSPRYGSWAGAYSAWLQQHWW